MATLWRVSDNSTPRLMSDFYHLREHPAGRTKAEALRLAQLALLNGTAQVKRSPRRSLDPEKGASEVKVQIILMPPGGKRDSDPRRDTNETVFVYQKDAPHYHVNKATPYAHPYYWAPFVLFGNWR